MTAMTSPRPIDRPPFAVRLVDPIMRRLLHVGVPLGPNALMTVRGRSSGEPRTAAVAVIEIDDRRWVISAYGEMNWVRNLRAARAATLVIQGQPEAVSALELSPAEAERFFRTVLIPYVHAFPLPVRLFGRLFVGDILRDPAAAVAGHPAFELRPK